MSELQTLLERNQQFATEYKGKNLSILPKFSTIVLTCSDARIDPAHYLGLELGEALVFRNGGGRVTHDIEVELGVLSMMANKMSGGKFTGFSLALIQHTDCGFERLANPEIATAIHNHLHIEKEQIAEMSNVDHVKSIHADIERLRNSSLVPKNITVSGHIYNIADGLISEVVAPVSLARATQPV